MSLFLSTLSLRRATHAPSHSLYPRNISIHALLAESDAETAKTSIGDIQFLSTLSLRRATFVQRFFVHYNLFLSTLSLRRATGHLQPIGRAPRISIHALLAESDPLADGAEPHAAISIHALLAESDRGRSLRWPSMPPFLSTLSLRRATAKVHKTVGHFSAYETNFMGIASSC